MKSICGISVQTAGIAVGWISMCTSILWMVGFTMCLAHNDEMANIVMSELQAGSTELVLFILFTIGTFGMVLSGISFFSAILLIVGTVKTRHLLLVPWLIDSGVSLLINGAYIIFQIIALFTTDTQLRSIPVFLIATICSFLTQYIIWLTIYVLFRELRRIQAANIPLATYPNIAHFTQPSAPHYVVPPYYHVTEPPPAIPYVTEDPRTAPHELAYHI